MAFLQKVLGAYVEDDWQAHANLSLTLGLRYDWANYFHDNNNLAPRGSFAWSLGASHATVIRGGTGVFYEHTGERPIADVLHYRDGGLVRLVVTNPGYPDPFQGGGSVASTPPSVVRFSPNIRIPYVVQYTLGVERQLQKGTTLAIAYIGSRGYDQFLSRDVNAPPPPLYLTRPDPRYGVIREIEATGHRRSRALETTLRGRITPWFSGQLQYTLSKTMNDTGGIGWFPANDYDLPGEWARADFDRRHRFFLLGQIRVGRLMNVGVALRAASGAPYSETLGQDVFNDGRADARPPGVGRNTLQAFGYANLDIKLSRDITVGGGPQEPRTLTLGLDAFNVLNHVNLESYVGDVNSPFFGQPVAAGPLLIRHEDRGNGM